MSSADATVGEIRSVIIIGSGPAGYTAAIYTARANLKPLVLEGPQFGGALMTTTEVENFPGFVDGVLGPDLMDSMRSQAERFGAEFVSDDVTEVNLTGAVKRVSTATNTYLARTVIVATGSRWRALGLPAEQRLLGRGVSSCATCDGFFFRGRNVMVVGGGDSAMEEANFLTRFADTVTVLHRRSTLRASKIMQERAFANPKIRFRWDTEVLDILGKDSVEGVRVRHIVTGEESVIPTDGFFLAIGHDPRSEPVRRPHFDLDEENYVLVQSPTTRTNLAGVFACGDVVDHTYRQAITAAGTGCAAALDAERYIAANEAEEDLLGMPRW